MNCAVHTETPAAAFCRTCGKALCENCKRDVMGAIYCEPCIAVRLQTPPPPPGQPVIVPVVPGAPNPGIAAFLGFIPGVGAMYNGQFMKAFIHVLIFAFLIYGSGNMSGVLFGLMIPVFVFYMVFEAFKTAQAKQFGLPAPDPLGINKMFGIHESQPQPVATVAVPSATGTDPASGVPGTAAQHSDPLAGAPIGAIVLIGLGAIFMFSNFYNVDMHRMWPLFLIALGLWIAYKRTMQRG